MYSGQTIIMEERDEGPKNSLIFTRYLYSLEETKHALFLSLLDRDLDQALFWAYEIFYSGHQEHAFDYCLSIYETVYHDINDPRVLGYLHKVFDTWKQNQSDPYAIAVIVQNIIVRPYSVNRFIDEYMSVRCVDSEVLEKKKRLFLYKIKEEDMKQYETIITTEPGKARHVLKKACRYACRKEVRDLFHTSHKDIRLDYFDHWLYYAAGSPLWLDRIHEYGGTVNEETKCIDFEDEEREEKFYDLYGYEPDEQAKYVYEKSIGTGLEKQMSIKEFAEAYGGRIFFRSVHR